MYGRLKINSGTNTNPSPSLEEKVVVALFAICASVWIVGLLLATFGKGRRCVSVVSTLTYLSVASIVAFVIFALSKTMPEETFYTILFATHFVLMISAITCVWAKYVKDPRISLPSLQVQKIRWLIITLCISQFVYITSTAINMQGLLQILGARWRYTPPSNTQQHDQLKEPLLDIV